MKPPRALFSLFILLALHVPLRVDSASFYVDPDWTGAHSGLPSQPWQSLDSTAWNAINNALAGDDVTVYFAALKANGTTQQSAARFIQIRRVDPSSHRLTLDGYSQYNTSETSPSWTTNPDADISHAYRNGKVFKSTGDGNAALGWYRVDGNDFVIRNGLVYCCIESHTASPDNEPGVGANWRLYWDQNGSSTTAWSSGTKYKCYAKQNNITLRGFETTARCAVNGDNLVWKYNYIHDTTAIGPGLELEYTSVQSPSAHLVSRPSTNMTFRNFRIERTFGEGFYLGSINPETPASFQAAHGNQHSHILIENFYINHPGVNGGQGDGIDGKNGITCLTIRLGEITGFGANGNGINIGQSATNTDQHILVERCFIHDSTFDNQGAQRAIHAQTGFALSASMYGFNGVTIRNNVIANCFLGIQFEGDTASGQPATYGYIFNNTVYNMSPGAGLQVFANISNTVVKNNFVFGGATPQANISSSGVTSDYNAHDGILISSSEGSHTITLSTTQAFAAVVNATREDFHPSANSPLNRIGLTLSDFSDDFYQRFRAPGNWNIGAVQVGEDVSAVPSGSQAVP